MVAVWTLLLLVGSNVFMTFAWYGHLKFKATPLVVTILVSWGIAFFEYCLQVPANRLGHERFSGVQLKILQEVITLTVFGFFAVLYLKERLWWNHIAAFALLVAAVLLTFGIAPPALDSMAAPPVTSAEESDADPEQRRRAA